MSSKEDTSSPCVCHADPFRGSVDSRAICFFTESLILAQDERWRRA
jgi:hypothetical protein